MGDDWVPAPPHNVPGRSDLANPLQSSHGSPTPSGLADHFIAKAPIGSVAARITLLYQATPFRVLAPAGRQLQPILRTTFPVPQPCSVIIGSDVANDGQFPRPRRLSFLDSRHDGEGNDADVTGCVFVEWGVGPAREMLWLDLAQHSLQLPTTSFVQVSAYAGGSSDEDFFEVGDAVAEVSATVIPGHTLRPSAHYSVRLADRLGNGPGSVVPIQIPPFARRFTLAAWANFATVASLRFFDAALQPLAHYQQAVGPAPTAAVPDGAPHGIPVPGGAETAELAFTPVAGALQNASSVLTFEVAP